MAWYDYLQVDQVIEDQEYWYFTNTLTHKRQTNIVTHTHTVTHIHSHEMIFTQNTHNLIHKYTIAHINTDQTQTHTRTHKHPPTHTY